MTAFLLASTAAMLLGLLAGSLLLEGAVLVPFWKTLKPEEFFAFQPIFGQQLFRYFAPLTVLAGIMPVGSALWSGGSNIGLNISAVASLITLSFFPLYFKRANAAFSNGLVPAEALSDRLAQWGKVHNLRIMVAMVACGSAVLGLHAIN